MYEISKLARLLLPGHTPEQSTLAFRRSINHAKHPLAHLSVSLEVEGVVSLPGLCATGGRLVVSVTLAQTTRLLSGRRKSTGFAVLVDWVDDPVDASITADGLVLRIDEDDLEVLVGGVLVDPVGVQDTQVGAATSPMLLSSGLQ